jgi:hypothetical protein
VLDSAAEIAIAGQRMLDSIGKCELVAAPERPIKQIDTALADHVSDIRSSTCSYM